MRTPLWQWLYPHRSRRNTVTQGFKITRSALRHWLLKGSTHNVLTLLYSFVSLLDYLISYTLRLTYEVKLGRTNTASTALPKCLVEKGLNYNFESRGFFSSNYLEVRAKKTACYQSRTLIAFAVLPSFSGLKSSGRQKGCLLRAIPSCLRPKRNTDTWSPQVCLHDPITPQGSPC